MRQLRALLFDPTYSQAILAKTAGQSFLFWLKYLWVVFGIYLLALFAAVVYYAPQLPRLAKDRLPDVSFHLSQGIASITPDQPLVYPAGGLVLIFDTTGQTTLDSYPSGYLFSRFAIVVKAPDGTIDSQPYSKDVELSFSTSQIAAWLDSHPRHILFWGLLGSALIIIIAGLAYTISQLVIIFFLTAILTLFQALRGRPLTFSSTAKLCFHAAVPPFLLSAVTLFSPGPFSWLVSLALFGYYYFTWVKRSPLQPFSP